MTQTGRGVHSATSVGENAAPEAHVHRLGNLAGSATQHSSHLSLSSQKWPCSQPRQMCWLNRIIWRHCWMIKRRKTSCESHAVPADVQDSKAVSAPNAPKPVNHFGQTSGVQEIQKGLHCPHMTKCRICSAYYLNCWGHKLKHKDEIPVFLISFTEVF